MTSKSAILYRMVTDKHICPYGIKSKDLLQRQGYDVEDHHLISREETDAFKAEHSVETTPQTFIGGERVGGFDALAKRLGATTFKQEGTTYQPVIVVFAVAFMMALAVGWVVPEDGASGSFIMRFVAFSMCLLAVQKLRDLYTFSNQFVTYDLLAMRWVPYAYVYPFAELLAGLGMLAGLAIPLVALVALIIGTIGAVSVIKAVYIDKRDLKCACVGGDSNVPLGAISLTENLMMAGMGCWMLF